MDKSASAPARPLFLLASAFLLHAVHLLSMPNAVGSGWLGYTRTRFVLIGLSVLLATSLFQAARARHLPGFAAAARRTRFFLPILGLLITFCVQVIIWPEFRLPTALLSLRENFGITLLWAIPVSIGLGLTLLRASAASLRDFFISALPPLLFLVYVNLRVYTGMTFRYAHVQGDGVEYLGFENFDQMAAHGGLWGLTRPFLLPLIGTWLQKDAEAFAWLQTFVSVISWGWLAHVASSQLKTPLWRLSAFGLVLLFSAQERIVIWDWSILSESFTLSLMAVLLACWMLLTEKPTWPRLLLMLGISALWAFTRDLHAWILLLTGLLSLFGAFFASHKKIYIAAFAGLLLVFLASNHSVNAAGLPRWTIPYMHVLLFDVWPDPEARSFFESHGLTVPAHLLDLRTPTTEDFYGYTFAPEFSDFRTWLFTKGQDTLARYLLHSAPESLLLPINPSNGYPLEPQVRSGRFWDYQPVLPEFTNNIFTGSLRNPWSLLFIAGLFAFSANTWIRTKSPIWTAPLAGVLLSYAYAFLSWHGDAFERTRHVLPADIHLRASLVLLLLFAGDKLVQRLKTPLNQ
ncbi:MAG: hypothetical protein KIS85_05565 [Anaerolineales bacterium]|nr:hypothetical protein [Anaerolineales bacterium]